MSRDRRWHRPWAEPKVSRAGRPRARPTPGLLLVGTASCHLQRAWLPGCPGEQPAPPTAQPLGSKCCFCSFGISGTRVGKRLWVIRPGPVAIARGGRATQAVCPPAGCQISPGVLGGEGSPRAKLGAREMPTVLSLTGSRAPSSSGSFPTHPHVCVSFPKRLGRLSRRVQRWQQRSVPGAALRGGHAQRFPPGGRGTPGDVTNGPPSRTGTVGHREQWHEGAQNTSFGYKWQNKEGLTVENLQLWTEGHFHLVPGSHSDAGREHAGPGVRRATRPPHGPHRESQSRCTGRWPFEVPLRGPEGDCTHSDPARERASSLSSRTCHTPVGVSAV